MISIRYFLGVLIIIVCPSAFSQDTEQKIEALVEARSKSIAEIDKEFLTELSKLRENRLRELEEKMAAAMKSLDLEKSNDLNRLIEDWKNFSPKLRRRMIFVRVSETENEKPWFFSRGPDGIWIECTPNNLFQHKETSETPEYIELSADNGFVHRLYEKKNMYRGPGMKSFEFGSRGKWLTEMEIVTPGQK